MKRLNVKKLIALALSLTFTLNHLPVCATSTTNEHQHHGHIQAEVSNKVAPEFDIVHAKITTKGSYLVFQQAVKGQIGMTSPEPVGQLAGASVYSYVWPTSLNSSTVGFEADQGILALALTVHPDFDDTPLYDEDGDGNKTNDGDKWHSHWVVLTQDDACGKGALKVKDIPAGTHPKVPATWPRLPIFIDSPGFDFRLEKSEVLVRVPLSAIGFAESFSFDGVTAGLKINQQVHAPLLCVNAVFDVASGDLSLPGISQ